MATRSQIVAEARSWLNTRWLHQGNVKGVGVDCLNLLSETAKAVGLKVEGEEWWEDDPNNLNYGRYPNGETILRGCNKFLDRIHFNQLKAGDMVLFRFVEGGEPQHFAFITDTNPALYMIHAYGMSRKVVEHRMDENWRKRIVACYRFRNLED